MWTYVITTGILSDGTREIRCYSGNYGMWQNNPMFMDVKGKGPICEGEYTIGTAFTDPIKGTYVMRLQPDPANTMFGRDGFEIHADSIENPGHASDGCIVTCGPMARDDREYINASPFKQLKVVAA